VSAEALFGLELLVGVVREEVVRGFALADDGDDVLVVVLEGNFGGPAGMEVVSEVSDESVVEWGDAAEVVDACRGGVGGEGVGVFEVRGSGGPSDGVGDVSEDLASSSDSTWGWVLDVGEDVLGCDELSSTVGGGLGVHCVRVGGGHVGSCCC